MAQRTIVDVLRRGHLEAFHTAMLAWLLDADEAAAEHGLGDLVLRGLADRLARHGGTPDAGALADALRGADRHAIKAEAVDGAKRYDLELRVGGRLFAIENKVTSRGTHEQLDRYQEAERTTIALGLSRANFDGEALQRYPFLSYADVLAVLQDVRGASTAEPEWAFLIDHYLRHLDRDLARLRAVEALADGRDGGALDARGPDPSDQSTLRFLALHYFWHVSANHLDRGHLAGRTWGFSKDQMQGVIMWPEGFGEVAPRFGGLFTTPAGARLYPQVALGPNWLSPGAAVIGAIELRASRGEPAEEEALRVALGRLAATEGFEMAKRPKRTCSTYTVLRRTLTRRDLAGEALAGGLDSLLKRVATADVAG